VVAYPLLRYYFGLPSLEDSRRSIVEAHGGQIGVSSPSGQGDPLLLYAAQG
jgi:hypothetical protein